MRRAACACSAARGACTCKGAVLLALCGRDEVSMETARRRAARRAARAGCGSRARARSAAALLRLQRGRQGSDGPASARGLAGDAQHATPWCKRYSHRHAAADQECEERTCLPCDAPGAARLRSPAGRWACCATAGTAPGRALQRGHHHGSEVRRAAARGAGRIVQSGAQEAAHFKRHRSSPQPCPAATSQTAAPHARRLRTSCAHHGAVSGCGRAA